jgi:hypothetical protein
MQAARVPAAAPAASHQPRCHAATTSRPALHASLSNTAHQQQRQQVACRAGRLPTVAFFGRKQDPELTVVKLQVGWVLGLLVDPAPACVACQLTQPPSRWPTQTPCLLLSAAIHTCRAAGQVGMFGDVEAYQRQLDRIAGVLDGDDEDAMGDLVHGEVQGQVQGQGQQQSECRVHNDLVVFHTPSSVHTPPRPLATLLAPLCTAQTPW